jgi:allophanate hydrolase subunit 1
MTDEVLLQSISISDFSEDEDVVKVDGYMAHEGVLNRQTFTKEELEKAAKSFIGRPIMKEHTKAVDEVIGTITDANVQFDEKTQTYGLHYEGQIGAEHTKLVKDIKRQFVSDVSMRIGYESSPTHYCNICGSPIGRCSHSFSNPEFAPIATNFHGKHLAVVTQPADRTSSITMSFSDDGQVYDEIEEFLRRTNMSDFEEKYTNLVEEFSEFKMNHNDEITKLENDFKEQKAKLESDMAEKVNDYVSLKADFDAMSAEKEELEKKVEELENEFSAIEAEKLNSLRKEVSALNKEVYGNLTEEQINSFEEATLKQYVDLFSHQKSNMPSVKPNVDSNNQYQGKDFEDANPVDSLLNRIQ